MNMNDKEKLTSRKAQEMLKHVQESMKQLQSLQKKSLADLADSDPEETFEEHEDDNFKDDLFLSSSPLPNSTPAPLYDKNLFSCPQMEITPVNYISIKGTLDSFLYDQEDRSESKAKDLQLEAMAMELKELASVQDHALHDLTIDLDALTYENKLLNERNRSLLSENEKLEKIVESLSREAEQLKHHIMSMRTSPLSFEPFEGSSAGTTATIPCLDAGVDISLSNQHFQNDPESPQEFSDASNSSSWVCASNGSNVEENPEHEHDVHVNGDHRNVASLPFSSPDVVSCGDSAPNQNDKKEKKKKMGNAFLKIFRRHRKGKYNVN